MATGHTTTEQIPVIRIDIDGKKYCLELAHSSSAAQLRTILSERYKITTDTCFLYDKDFKIHPKDEQNITISKLLSNDNLIRLKTEQSKPTPIPIPERKNTIPERKTELKYPQPLSQSTRTTLPEVKIPGSTPTRSENKIVLATDLDRDMRSKIFRNCNLFYGIRMDGETPKRAVKPVFKFKESNGDFPLFQVTDDSNIRTYMTDKEMQNSFLSSKFFDGGVEISSPFVGIGINAEYSNSKAVTNTKRTVYLTHCFNYPRASVTLHSSYLEPTPDFIQAIDSVLSTVTQDEQITKLEEVLSTYGHVYPCSVVLGGQLYHKEEHDNKEKAEEAKRRIGADVSLSGSFFKPAKIHAGGAYENQSQKKSSEQTSQLTFEAVGGDTRLSRDPTLWINTIADPSLWRIIEQDNYQSVMTLLDQERQKKLQQICNYHAEKKMIIKSNTKWKQDGITIYGIHRFTTYPAKDVTIITKGITIMEKNLSMCMSDCFHHARGIDIDDDRRIYIADYLRNCIVEWSPRYSEDHHRIDAWLPVLFRYSHQIVAGGYVPGDETDQLNRPTDVIIDKNNNSLIIADCGNRRVVRWSRRNTERGQIIISDIECYGLAMDKDGSLYVSDYEKNEVRRWKRGEADGTVVAGGNRRGHQLNQLNCPTYIFVDDDYSLYVSDANNHRVMKWEKGAREGTVVAGGNGEGDSLTQLSFPQGVIVDQFGQVYVVDHKNNRVMRWCKAAREGTVVAGGYGRGEASYQFNHPSGLSFDRDGNLYVADRDNNRIQKFQIVGN